MYSDPIYPCIPLPRLSDKAAVEILDFLQVFTNDFENRYSNQIRRYYDERSRHHIVQTDLFETVGDPAIF
ncbi:MAG: hypothetical protein Q7U78_06690 [Gallionella sp.]|nr:hypothetical protein [Gallionella sp.]